MTSRHAKVFISSADWMPRNLDGRVETLVPVENPTVRRQIVDRILWSGLKDDTNCWLMAADGSYARRMTGKEPFSSQDYFMTNPSLSGRGRALKKRARRRTERNRHANVRLMCFPKLPPIRVKVFRVDCPAGIGAENDEGIEVHGRPETARHRTPVPRSALRHRLRKDCDRPPCPRQGLWNRSGPDGRRQGVARARGPEVALYRRRLD